MSVFIGLFLSRNAYEKGEIEQQKEDEKEPVSWIKAFHGIKSFIPLMILGGLALALVILAAVPRFGGPAYRWLANHPLSDGKFFFFIFALIPVQTLFTYNWLVLPVYINRSYSGWIGEYFEIAANANPILIFLAVPMIALYLLGVGVAWLFGGSRGRG